MHSRLKHRYCPAIARAVATSTLLAAALTNHAGAAVLSSKRGFADVGANYGNLQATGAGWYYTWGTGAANPGGFDAEHYPMFWSAPSQGTIDNVKVRNPEYVLGFNEPERSDQANMTVAQAIAAWTPISNSFQGTSTKLVSPAVADTGGAAGGQAWLASFMSQAAANNLKVDAVAFHWYGVSNPNNPASAASSFLSRVDSYHNSYGKPVFITEFAIHDWGGVYTDEQITEANRQFLEIVIPGLESRSHVAGYSWYHWFGDARIYAGSPPTPTPMGRRYVGALMPGQTDDVGGKNLGEHVAYLAGGTLTQSGSIATMKYISALANISTISGTIDWALMPSGNWVRIQPGATLRKSGSNLINFGAATVTNHGVLEVAQGALRVGNSVQGSGSILISSTGGATGSTARLELSGRDVTLSQPITFAQRNDPAGSDGIRNVIGSNALTGPITLVVGGNQARIQSDAGVLTLSGGISTNATTARNLYLQGAGSGIVSGVIADNPADPAGLINLHKASGGTWTLSAANTYTGVTDVAAGRLVLAASLTTSSALKVTGGTTELAQHGARVIRTPTLTLTGPGKLDLRDNKLIVTAPGAIGGVSGTTYTGVQGLVQSARNGGTWDGPGVTSSMPDALTGLTSIGVATGAQLRGLGPSDTGMFASQTVTADSTIAMYTYTGDANLDGFISADDYAAIDFAIRVPGASGWYNGDFNWDGFISADDYSAIDFSLVAQGAPFSTSGFAEVSTASAVPEPASACGFAVIAAGLVWRRQGRRADLR